MTVTCHSEFSTPFHCILLQPSAKIDPVLIDELDTAEQRLRAQLAYIRADEMSSSDAVALLERCLGLERILGSLNLVASKVEESRIWAKEGHISATHWIATRSRDSIGSAKGLLGASSGLADCPGIQRSVRGGSLSISQTREIGEAVKVDPDSERRLLQAAEQQDPSTFRSLCTEVRHSKTDPKERYRRIHRSRRARIWTDRDGAFRLEATLTPDAGAKLWSRVEDEAKLMFRESRRAKCNDRMESIQADALVRLVCDEPMSTPTSIVMKVDAGALESGRLQPGENCTVKSGTSIPVEVARGYLPDSFIKSVVRNGTNIESVSHHKRTINAKLKTALEERFP